MANNTIHHAIAVLKMPAKMGDKIIKAQTIAGKMTNNATFPVAGWPSNVISLVQTKNDIATLVAAETAVANRTGTAAARDTAMATVMTDLRSIMSMVQQKADITPANASDIIQNAGFEVKKSTIRQKRQNAAINTQIVGTIMLTADGTGHHEWQMSKDKISITNLPATSTSHTLVTGLKPGDVWYFRNHKVNTNKTIFNWTPWIELTIGAGGKSIGGGNTHSNAGNIPSASNL